MLFHSAFFGQSIFFFSLAAALLLFIMNRVRFDTVTRLLYCTALACSFLQFITTSHNAFAPDIGGHEQYIHYIAKHFSLPAPLGWQSQQPPLFYFAAALFTYAGRLIGYSPDYSARMAAVFFYYGSALFSGLLLRRFIPVRSIYCICLTAFLFWPAATHTSVKISNDVGQFFFAAGFIYFLTGWLQDRHSPTLGWAMAFAGGAIATKSTGMLPVCILIFFLLYQMSQKQCQAKQLLSRSVLIGAAFLILCTGINFGRIYYWKNYEGASINWLINRKTDYHRYPDFVRNKPENYFCFRGNDFINTPYPRMRGSLPEAQCVPNVLLKTLLYDIGLNYPDNVFYAQAINALFLLCLFCLVALYMQDEKTPLAINAKLLMAFCAIVMVICARISVPISNQGNGRYIYIFVPLFLTLYGHFLSALFTANRHAATFYASLLCLVGLMSFSIIFTFARWDWPLLINHLLQ